MAPLVVEHGLQVWGWTSEIVVQRLSCSAACEIFQTRDWTCVPCTGRHIVIHWAAREVPAWANFLDSLYTHTLFVVSLIQNVSEGRASACIVACFLLRQFKNKYASPWWEFISCSFTQMTIPHINKILPSFLVSCNSILRIPSLLVPCCTLEISGINWQCVVSAPGKCSVISRVSPGGLNGVVRE